MTLQEIIKGHLHVHQSDNFEGWKLTEILYCKLSWCLDVMQDMEEHYDILLDVQDFIEDLQQLEKEVEEDSDE